jgi:DNA primase
MAAMRGRGHRLVGPCPVHRGDNPTAFVVDLRRQLWFCFSRCHAGGDVVDLVRRMDHLGYRQTAVELARLAAIDPVSPDPTWAGVRAPPTPSAFRPFTKRLHLDPHAPFLAAKGIHAATAATFDAGQWHLPGFLRGCIGVRLHDVHGAPLGYAGRRLDPREARIYGKWKLPPALPKTTHLFNYHRVRDALADGVVVVECPWAVMRLHQLQLPAVALLGTSLSPSQRELLAPAARVVLMLDGDAAGRTASRLLTDGLGGDTRARTCELPSGLDPDDLTDAQLAALASSLLGRDPTTPAQVPGPTK